MRRSTKRVFDRRVLAAAAALVTIGGILGVTQISNADVGPGGADGNNNGLEVLGRDCTASQLEPHGGFQDGSRCVSTQMGEVGDAARNPALLIVGAPRAVEVGEAFQLQVSTRNLVRDRFLGAAAGGYYLESSFLDEAGLQRGHFHAACRMLASTDEAPDPEPAPDFFRAVEDGAGGDTPDTVTVEVATGMPAAGIAQCAVWAGDGSHRLPMMQRANQTPAVDLVRIEVRGTGEEPPAEEPPAEEPPAEEPPAEEPPAEEPPAEEPPAEEPPAEEPPAEEPPAEEPPAEEPPAEEPPAEEPPAEEPPAEEPPAEEPPAEDDDNAPPANDDEAEVPQEDVAQEGDDAPPIEDTADASDNDNLALTGTNAIAIIVAGALLLLGGLVLISATRRRSDY